MNLRRSNVFFCLGLILAGLGPALGEDRKVALVVGVRVYANKSLKDLDYPVADAAALAETLRESGFSKVVTLNSDLEGRLRPSFANVEREIESILRDLDKKDLLLIALSGHGQENDDGENFFCCYDANPFTYEHCIALQPLLNRMHQCGVGSALLLVDACRDEAKLPRGAKGASGETILSLPAGVSAFFSCASDERSWESREAGGGHGIFLHTFMEGLQGSAANERGNVTWDGLIAHVKDNVPDHVREWIGPRFTQSPHSVGNLVGSPVLRTLPPAPRRESMRRPSSDPLSDTASNAKSITSQTTSAKLVLIPAGEFMMGAEEFNNEKPVHRVKITLPFYLGETEVTQGEWKRVMGTEPWKGKENVKEGDDYPATYVSWEDAVEYCKRLSQQDSREYRLPTEAEWEYACRAGTQTRWSFGDSEDELSEYAWYDGNANSAGEQYAHRVGQKKSNGFGLYDMHGNVWEWCSDWYGKTYYGESPAEDPPGPSKGPLRVVRGGGWINDPVDARSADRNGFSPGYRLDSLGFRLASSSRE